jgi:hypothetical protein
VQKIRLAAVRCAYGQTAARPYPELQYLKFGGVCQGQGSYEGKDSTQLVVACRSFATADANGHIAVQDGQVDEATGDCSFATPEGPTKKITRDDAGLNELVTLTGGAQSATPVALTCSTQRVATAGSDGACDESLLTVPADTAAEAAWLGVQGVCVTAESCTEVSGLAAASLKAAEGACAAQKGSWRSGTCALADTTYKSGCLKTPAAQGDTGSIQIVWTPGVVACTP